MKLTTENIIKMLPFEDAFKNELLTKWDSLSSDQKFAITEIVWDAYTALYQISYEANTDAAFLRIQEGKEHADADFGKRIREQTEKEMQSQFNQAVPVANLSETREALQDIINQTSF